jgi:hypothetical protein
VSAENSKEITVDQFEVAINRTLRSLTQDFGVLCDKIRQLDVTAKTLQEENVKLKSELNPEEKEAK